MADLELRKISKQFDRQFAVKDVNLHVQDGELVVLLGPSGCGKSTLMRLIAGLESPTQGQVLIGGQDKTPLRPKDRNVALVFQSYALYPHLSIYENIAFPLRVRGVPSKTVDAKVMWAARLLDIERLLQRKPRHTSGGERQRTALARSLVRDPAVFLLDEPLSNLDAKMRHAAREELRSFQHQVKATWIHVTHDQTEAMGLGDRIVVMDKGRVRQIGTPGEIYRYPADTFVATFVGSPPMNLMAMDDHILGFRPESCLPTAYFENEIDLFKVAFRLQRAEYLGNETLLYAVADAPLPSTKMIARIPSTLRLDVAQGERYEFAVRRSDLRYFGTDELGAHIDRHLDAIRA